MQVIFFSFYKANMENVPIVFYDLRVITSLTQQFILIRLI